MFGANLSRRAFIGLGVGAGLAGAGVLTARPSAGQPVQGGTLVHAFRDPINTLDPPGAELGLPGPAAELLPGPARVAARARQVRPGAGHGVAGDAGRDALHLHAARGREVPRRHAVQRGRGQGHVRPHRGSAAEGAPDRAAGPLRRHRRPGRPPGPGAVQGAVPALPPLPERDRAPARVAGRRQEVGRRLRPEHGGHRPVRAHEVHARGDHLRALRRLQLGAGVPGPQGSGLPRPGGPAPRAGGVDAAHRARARASRS